MNKLVLTCEHGGNKIPSEYKEFFKNSNELLSSHKGYDIGALELFNVLNLNADYSAYSETSRLLVELNRSLHHKNLFSKITKSLDDSVKRGTILNYYFPYRNEVENKIASLINKGNRIIHISVHTFTPVFNNETRNCDIGLLYDSKHKLEKDFCKLFQNNICAIDSALKVRFNYPYLGTADGFTSYLRKKFSSQDYLGIEIEVNQLFPINSGMDWIKIKSTILESLKKTYQIF